MLEGPPPAFHIGETKHDNLFEAMFKVKASKLGHNISEVRSAPFAHQEVKEFSFWIGYFSVDLSEAFGSGSGSGSGSVNEDSETVKESSNFCKGVFCFTFTNLDPKAFVDTDCLESSSDEEHSVSATGSVSPNFDEKT